MAERRSAIHRLCRKSATVNSRTADKPNLCSSGFRQCRNCQHMPRSLFRLAAEFFNAVVHECQSERTCCAPLAAFEIDNRDVEIASLHNLTNQKKNHGWPKSGADRLPHFIGSKAVSEASKPRTAQCAGRAPLFGKARCEAGICATVRSSQSSENNQAMFTGFLRARRGKRRANDCASAT